VTDTLLLRPAGNLRLPGRNIRFNQVSGNRGSVARGDARAQAGPNLSMRARIRQQSLDPLRISATGAFVPIVKPAPFSAITRPMTG
jgi:hypothetical protein